MPFDGSGYERRIQALDKMDKVIDLLSDPARWCKRHLRTPDGRRCIVGAIIAADAEGELERPILLAIKQVTGGDYRWIQSFNDHPLTNSAGRIWNLRTQYSLTRSTWFCPKGAAMQGPKPPTRYSGPRRRLFHHPKAPQQPEGTRANPSPGRLFVDVPRCGPPARYSF